MQVKRLRAALFAPLALAAGILLAETQTGDYSLTNLGEVRQPALLQQTDGAVYGVSAYPTYRPALAPGEDRRLVEDYCSSCHSIRYITMQPPLPAATWEAEVNKMIKTFGQPIPEEVQPKIIKYLQTHYTPETRKK
ncbi:MAG TPA: hypothetical protein VGR03_05845 [Candidatus Acidoferrum sp.]|nr:hypothetical protein [Candidatus Acidoferrum sp.]